MGALYGAVAVVAAPAVTANGALTSFFFQWRLERPLHLFPCVVTDVSDAIAAPKASSRGAGCICVNNEARKIFLQRAVLTTVQARRKQSSPTQCL